jgi:hypothetical protein
MNKNIWFVTLFFALGASNAYCMNFSQDVKKFIKKNGTLSVENDDNENEHAQIFTWSYNQPYTKFLGLTLREQPIYFSERKIKQGNKSIIDPKFVREGIELPRLCLRTKVLLGAVITSGIACYLYNYFAGSQLSVTTKAPNVWDYYLSKF